MERSAPHSLLWWGKAQPLPDATFSWHPLPYHMLDVAAVGLRMLEVRPARMHKISELSGMTPDILRPWLTFLIALHDLGKFDTAFQGKVPELARRNLLIERAPLERFRHDLGGLIAWHEILLPALIAEGVVTAEIGGERLDAPEAVARALKPWLTATCGHHGIPPLLSGERIEWAPATREAAIDLAISLARLFQLPPLRLASGRPSNVLRSSSWIVAGLTNIADWIGSQQNPFRYTEPEQDIETYWLLAQDRARTGVRAAGLEPASPMPSGQLSDLLPPDVDPSPMQVAAAEMILSDEPTLVIVEDSTGSGKTEAALHLVRRLLSSGRADGLYFALPTMATANAMHGRVERLLGLLFGAESRPTLVLAHSASHLPPLLFKSGGADFGADRDQPSAGQAAAAWFRDHRKAALHATVGVGTIDQALVAVLPTRHGQLRLSGLQGKVLVVDEVHAYDDYMRKVLARLLTFHARLGGSAILLSATLPGALRSEFIQAFRGGVRPGLDTGAPFPLLTVASTSGVQTVAPAAAPTRVCFTRVSWVESPVAALERIVGVVESGGCVCWLRNTVRDAQASFDAARARLPPDAVHLFHARVCLGHRLEREQDVIDRFGPGSTPELRRGRLLVATQVVEQSLDLDFDLLVSDLAPVDLLIQRAGRIHRHPRTSNGARTTRADERGAPDLVVMAPVWNPDPDSSWPGSNLSGTTAVYKDRARLWRSQKILIEHGGIRVPDEARILIEAVYNSDGTIPLGLERATLKAEGERRAAGDLGDFNALRFEDGYCATGGEWLPDTETPTRQGGLSRTWLLLDADENPPQPLYDPPQSSYTNDFDRLRLSENLSQISLHAGCLAAPPLDERPSTCPDGSPLLLHHVDGGWEGSGRTPGGDTVILMYDPVRGLQIQKDPKVP